MDLRSIRFTNLTDNDPTSQALEHLVRYAGALKRFPGRFLSVAHYSADTFVDPEVAREHHPALTLCSSKEFLA